MLPVATLATGAAMVGLAYMSLPWHLIALFAVMGLVGMSGPGSLVTSVPVLKWFVRDRGRAIAFTSLGIPIGAVLFVPLTQILIDEVGWQTAWVVLAIIGVTVIVPLSADPRPSSARGHGPAAGRRGVAVQRGQRGSRSGASGRGLVDGPRGDTNLDAVASGGGVQRGASSDRHGRAA